MRLYYMVDCNALILIYRNNKYEFLFLNKKINSEDRDRLRKILIPRIEIDRNFELIARW